MTGKPVHTRLAGLASHAVLSSTCKIAVSPLNPTSESARTFRRLPAASVNWLLRESGSGASTASTVRPRFDLHAANAHQSSQLFRFVQYLIWCSYQFQRLFWKHKHAMHAFTCLNRIAGHAVPRSKCRSANHQNYN